MVSRGSIVCASASALMAAQPWPEGESRNHGQLPDYLRSAGGNQGGGGWNTQLEGGSGAKATIGRRAGGSGTAGRGARINHSSAGPSLRRIACLLIGGYLWYGAGPTTPHARPKG